MYIETDKNKKIIIQDISGWDARLIYDCLVYAETSLNFRSPYEYEKIKEFTKELEKHISYVYS